MFLCFSTLLPFEIICAGDGGATTSAGRSIYRRLCDELWPVVRVKTDKRQNITSQNLCDGWAKYRQNAYIS